MADVSVRPAIGTDAPAIAEVQARTWREAYGGILPAAALRALATVDAEARWRDAVTAPPSSRHHVLAAVEDGQLVGFAALAPALDDGLDPADTDELLTLLVQPAAHRHGHGSRLLAAAVSFARDGGAATAVTWVFETDAAMIAFLESAGWALDGTVRELAVEGESVRQVRLHTALAG